MARALYYRKIRWWLSLLVVCILISHDGQSQLIAKTAIFHALPSASPAFTQNNEQRPDGILHRIKAKGVVPMNTLLQSLKPNQRKGSKPRCHLLTHGTPEQVAERLTKLIAPLGFVATTDSWMPQGFVNLEEAQLHNAERLLDKLEKKDIGQTLQSWWLATAGSTTPNWDIASTCTIDGKPGLLLVEAKAHHAELKQNDSCGASNEENRKRIEEAIHEANSGLNMVQDGWNLSHSSHYQLCNRFAWSWKLATLGIPVVLVYLGFTKADEMPNPFPDEESWEIAVRDYSKDFVPDSVWGSKLMLNDVPIYPLIRSMTIQLDSIDEVDVRGKVEVNQGRP